MVLGYGWDRNRTVATGSTTTTPRRLQLGRFYHQTPGVTTSQDLAPNQYLSSDRIVIRSIRRLCSFSRSFTSRFQICDLTNTCGVAIESPRFWLEMCPYFTAIQWISVGSLIRMQEMKQLIKLHNQRIHHVMIWSELNNLMAANAVGTVKLQPQSGSNLAENPGFYVWPR